MNTMKKRIAPLVALVGLVCAAMAACSAAQRHVELARERHLQEVRRVDRHLRAAEGRGAADGLEGDLPVA